MIQLTSSDGLNFEASDQLDQSNFWFSLVKLILSKFLSNFKVSVIWDHSSFWFNLVQLTQILLVQLIFSTAHTVGATWSIKQLNFKATHIFGSLFFRREYSINQGFWRGLEEGVFEVGEWDQYIAYTYCVCVLWRDRMKGYVLRSSLCNWDIW